MTSFVRSVVSRAHARRLVGPAIVAAAVALTAQAAFAVGDGGQDKPQLKVEAERTPQGARLTFDGKGWPAGARVKLSATRAPGSTAPQEFGMVSADSGGVFKVRKVAGCSTDSDSDVREMVTFTATDSATSTQVSQKIQGASWKCM